MAAGSRASTRPFALPGVDEILAAPRVTNDQGELLGRSREGRPIRGFRIGNGPRSVSLLGGCHADEPVGPRLLRHLVTYLESLDPEHPALRRWQWWILPHINPDGEARNAAWAAEDTAAYDPGTYLAHVVREKPGDDIEFGFPRDAGEGGSVGAVAREEVGAAAGSDERARPENRAALEWWRGRDRPFALHVSLHGMGFAAGPWFLLEAAWRGRLTALRARCQARVHQLGYVLHDVEREGEKGFVRLGRGFTTRPDSRAMRAHFEELGEPDTAALFRPSSMETIRSLDGDVLTLVSEMPLFLTPGVGETLGPPDPVAVVWKDRIDGWRELAATDPDAASEAAVETGLEAMPVRDQMDLQWTLIRAGLDAALGEAA